MKTLLYRILPVPNDDPLIILEPVNTYSGPVFTVTLAPGDVRYIHAEEFFETDVEKLIAQIKQSAPCPTIREPLSFALTTKQRRRIVTTESFSRLIKGESWDVRLRLYHAVVRMEVKEGMPITLYCLFHSYLALGNQFGFAECVEAWVKGTENSCDLRESYRTSPEHIVVTTSEGLEDGNCSGGVFRKTNFVKERLLAIALETARQEQEAALLKERELASAEEEKAKEGLETLKKSRFDSFVYIMEDLRNKTFKIGRSKTPYKRERTLQSEVPEIVLRFSIPADEDDERRLHGRFDPQRQRGEWFSLTADELLWIVSFLKNSGDVARVYADYEWLGRITLQASAKSESE